MKRDVPVHNLRPNEKNWTPPAVACFDTETRSETDGVTETHTLRCWSARLDVRRDRRKSYQARDSDDGLIDSDLAVTLDAWARRHPTLWVYAHNLAFDLTTSTVTTHLAALGWEVTEFAIDSPSPFVKMSNGRSHITLVDSFSWLPAPLEEIAAGMGTSKVPLPVNDGSDAEWLERCRQDVDILADAMTEMMGWWDAHNLGHWSVTGSASGWNVMRHKIDARRFTINPSKDGIASDRSAVYGGRRGLWRAGTLKPGRYAELDFTSAYPVIAATLPLPLERMASFTSLPVGHRWITSDRHGIIARVRIRTDVPRWPARAGSRVWYPVGEFWTDLAGPDIAEAQRLGCLLEVGPGYVHRLGLALAPWAKWCLATADKGNASVPPAVRMWARHCGRAVIGKWAQRSFTTTEIGPAPTRGWHATEGWNHTSGVRAVIMDFDGKRWQSSATGDGDNCYPAVLAWVESYVRVRLSAMIERLPAGSVVACDTDGLILDLQLAPEWETLIEHVAPLVPRIKREYRQVEMIGPQHMVLDGKRRFAGVPAGAKPTGDGRLVATLWPKMVWQMGNGEQGTYTRPQQTYRVSGTYAPGWVLENGDVMPLQMTIGESSANEIVRWEKTAWHNSGMTLREDQNKDLRRYRDDSTGTRDSSNTENTARNSRSKGKAENR
jgi:hypothetical protein